MTERAPRSTALVTGGARGIGLELARLLAADGHDLVLVARTRERLEHVASQLSESYGVSAQSHALDLSVPGAASALWQDLIEAGTSIDILINDAGVGLHGAFAQQDTGALQALVGLNVTAVTTLTKLALPPMIARKHGRILNVASLVAFQPGGPGQATYYATKAFVLSLSRGLARELRGTGVRVTALCPGPTRTAFEETAGASETVLYKWLPSMNASAVARAGYRGMTRGTTVVVPGILAKLLAFAGQLPPRWIALEVNRLLLRSL